MKACQNPLSRPRTCGLCSAFLTIALGTFFWVIAGCGSPPVEEETGDDLPEVDVVRLEPETVSLQRQWIGVIRPLKTTVLRAPEVGNVIEVPVSDGDRVERDEPLVRMEFPELKARQAVLEEQRESREAELERWRRLAANESAGPAEVEEARFRLLEVGVALEETKARLNSAELRSPVSGRITAVATAPGARVSGDEVLLRVEDAESLGMRFRVPAKERRYLDHLERLTLSNQDGGEVPIRRIVTVDEEPGPRGFVSVEVWVEPGELEWPFEGRLSYIEEREALVVPWTAVARDEDRNWVAVVAGESPRIERRRVRLGGGQAHGIEVVEGLEPGDRILRFEPRSQPEGREVSL